MADPISQLRDAGFDDDQISAWAVEKRGTLTDAGFKGNDIDAYFAGGPVVPENVPQPVLRRFLSEDGFSEAVRTVNSAIGGDVAQRIGAAMQEGGAHGWGESPIGMSAEDTKKLQDIGLFAKPEAGYTWATGLQFVNESWIRPAYSAIETVFRGVNAAVHGAGAAAGQVVAEVTGANEAESARARRDFAQMAMVATLLTGASGQPMSRTTRSVTGEMHTEIVGRLPESGDFVASAKALTGESDAPPVVQQKLLKMYEEGGVHPAEIAADAKRDPVLHQKMLSSEAKDMPIKAAEEGGGKPPSEPPAPPKPPEEGSFAAAQKKVLDKISVGDRSDVKLSFDKLYTNAIDDLHPLKAVSEDAYQAARLTRGNFGKAQHFIDHGTFEFDTLATTGKPLREILDPVKDDVSGLRAYLASKRALEIEATGREPGIDTAAARRVVDEGKGKFDQAATELVAYQNSLLKYMKDSGVLGDAAYTAMVEANKAYVPFFRVFMAEEGGGTGGKGFGPGNPIKALKGSDRGIIDPLESVIKNTYAYISIAERNAVGVKLIDALKEQGFKETAKREKLTGAETELVDYLKQQGVQSPEALIDFVKASAESDGTTISAWRDGKRHSVEVNDPELVQAFRGLDQQSVGMFMRMFALPARTLRAGATLSPDFMARNIVRDLQTALVNSKGLFSPIDTIKGAVGAIRKDADFLNWQKAGGANSTMVALDRRYLQESLVALDKETGLTSRAWNVMTNPLAPLRFMSELMENATRLGEFKKVAGGGGPKELLQSGAFAAREVTLDFARMGAKMRSYNMVTAFANAQIQGMDRIVRGFKDRPINTTMKVAGGITLPSVLLWWANHGDPRYEELPDWQKDLFWIIPTDRWEPISGADAAGKPAHLLRQKGSGFEFNNGHIWRIPKPFELGVIFGSGAERILSATIGKDKEAFDKFGKSVLDVLTPSYIPTALVPVVEQFANRSTFSDRTLIPADLEKHLPEYQYTPYTMELSKALGQIISSMPAVREAAVEEGHPAGPVARAVTSPILIENYVRAWTGGLGVYAMQVADLGLRKRGILPDPVTPTPTLADIPFVKAFAVRYPSATTESIQKFYDEHAKNKKFYDTYMAKAQEGDAVAMERIQAAGGPMMFVQLDSMKEALSQQSKLVRDIYKNPGIPAGEKRQLIDGLYFSMIEIGQAGRQMIKQAEKVFAPVP